jgi:REP element-mobilizing transposase RayT
MARIARVVVEGIPYHGTQHGNGRQQVFRSGTDCGRYRSLLRECDRQREVAILAYCLMPNHTHLVCVPGRAHGRMHADFARHFNIARQSCGHVWQARFYSCPLDPPEPSLGCGGRWPKCNTVHFVGQTIALRGLSRPEPGRRHKLIVCPTILPCK